MSLPFDPRAPFTLGSWTVLAGESSLRDGAGHTVHVEPKVMDVLCSLAGRAGEVVSRDVLHAEVFGDAHVEPDGLFRYISNLRRALGDDAKAPRFVETIPKRGYRLLVHPQPVVAANDRSKGMRRRLAWYGAAVAAILAAVGWLFNVVTPSPVPASSTAVHTGSPAALGAFARARVFVERGSCDGYRRAIVEYQDAVRLDAKFRPAFNRYADALVASALLGCAPTKVAFQMLDSLVRTTAPLHRADGLRVAAARALFFDRETAEAGVLLGEALARPTGRTADVVVAAYLAASGKLESAIAEAQSALQRDPAAVGENWSVALALYFAGRFDEASQVLGAARRVHPESTFLRNLHLLTLAEIDVAAATHLAVADRDEYERLSFADAYVLAKAGDRARALAIIKQWEKHARRQWVPATALAAMYRAVGDRQGFSRWMRIAEHDVDAWLLFRELDPTLAE